MTISEYNFVRDDNSFTWHEIFDCLAPRLTLGMASSYLNTILNQYLNNKLRVKHKKDTQDLQEYLKKKRFASCKLKFS